MRGENVQFLNPDIKVRARASCVGVDDAAGRLAEHTTYQRKSSPYTEWSGKLMQDRPSHSKSLVSEHIDEDFRIGRLNAGYNTCQPQKIASPWR